ncbi:hypothetical protein L208DRAFT_1289656, partial [Tricholoma matsutake]
WTKQEEELLILFLCDNKDKQADGGNFRAIVWNDAVKHLAPHHKKGGVKTVKACQSRYAWVRDCLSYLISGLTGLSGFSWDAEHGMNIGVNEKCAWDVYTEKHLGAKSYAHKGFVLYDLMVPLMPSLERVAMPFIHHNNPGVLVRCQ